MFRILTLDGGGARGAFAAGVMAQLEQKLNAPITDYFDLIAGTSTGGVIAILKAIGHPMSVIEDIYANQLQTILKPSDPYFSGRYKILTWLTNPIVQLFTDVNTEELLHSKYSPEGVYSVMRHLAYDIKLCEINSCRLLIPSMNLENGDPFIFKTHHLRDQGDNYHFRAFDVILATGAAPSYFDPIALEDYGTFSDGGFWANHPGIAAYAEAVKIGTEGHLHPSPQRDPVFFRPNQISMLSIGTGFTHTRYTPPKNAAGVKWWATRYLDLMLKSQVKSTCFYLERLLHDRFVRLDFQWPDKNWGLLDDYRYAREMISIGKYTAEQQFSALEPLFFHKKKEPFVPYTPTSSTTPSSVS
jgi:hypothetical protein